MFFDKWVSANLNIVVTVVLLQLWLMSWANLHFFFCFISGLMVFVWSKGFRECFFNGQSHELIVLPEQLLC